MLGANGAGKSTLLALLCGERSAQHGGMTRLPGARVGICYQEDALFPKLSVEGHLRFFSKLCGDGGADATERLLDEVGLAEHRAKVPAALSGGQRRRLSLAVALAVRPDLLVLDEPTAGVDAMSRRQIWDVVLAQYGPWRWQMTSA